MSESEEAKAPRGGLLIMIALLIAMALFALYANVQHQRESRLETVREVPLPSPTPSPTPTATPSSAP